MFFPNWRGETGQILHWEKIEMWRPEKSKFGTIWIPLSHLQNIKNCQTREEERKRAINSGEAFIPD